VDDRASGQRITGMIELPTGTPVGKYEIVRKIATGGMAEIYLARARGTAGFEKLVVLKRILPHLASDPSFVNMFLDEARLAATLQHPNIADVYDVGDDGAYFFTMEYIHGQDVRALRHAERARGQRVPLAIALAVVHGTLAALDYAHDKRGTDGVPLGLVHRDVSSSNVLVSYDGAVKLVDFGIARATGAQHKTRTGTLKGKIPYMSPEQARGLAMDRRSDLFSLGVVLYELTVGRRPFRGESDFAILEKIVHYGAKPPAQVVNGYPPELEAIAMKLLARDPDQRYATGEEALHELEQVIAQFQLWVSPKAVGKYMRALFAAQIDAWRDAEQKGVAFEDHVAQTVSQHRGSDLMTPPSSFPAVRPPEPADDNDDRDGGDDSVAYHDTTGPATVAPPRASSAAIAPVAATAALPTVPLRPSRAKWVAIAALALAGAAAAAYLVVLRGGDAPAASGETATTTSAPAAPPQRPIVAPAPAAPASAAAAATTAPTPAVQTPAAAQAPAVVQPPPVAQPPMAGSVPAPTTPPPVARKPSTPHPPVVPARVDTKPPPAQPAKPAVQPQTWDPNSPFLPGQ
jgi:serine/threonine protein kinase